MHQCRLPGLRPTPLSSAGKLVDDTGAGLDNRVGDDGRQLEWNIELDSASYPPANVLSQSTCTLSVSVPGSGRLNPWLECISTCGASSMRVDPFGPGEETRRVLEALGWGGSWMQ